MSNCCILASMPSQEQVTICDLEWSWMWAHEFGSSKQFGEYMQVGLLCMHVKHQS